MKIWIPKFLIQLSINKIKLKFPNKKVFLVPTVKLKEPKIFLINNKLMINIKYNINYEKYKKLCLESDILYFQKTLYLKNPRVDYTIGVNIFEEGMLKIIIGFLNELKILECKKFLKIIKDIYIQNNKFFIKI